MMTCPTTIKHAIIKFTLTSLVITGALAVSPVKASAQSAIPLVVAPARQQFALNPGETSHEGVKYFNEGESPIAGNIKVVDFIVKDDLGSPVLLFDTNLSSRFSAAKWIDLYENKVSINPGTVKSIEFDIKVPADARPGGRYVAIYFEPTGAVIGDSAVQEGAQTATSFRLVGLISIKVNGPIKESALIKRFEVPNFVEYGPVEALSELINRGDYHITPQGQFELYDWFGRKIDEKVLDEKNIFPDASRSYVAKLGSKNMIGKLKVVFTSSYGDSGQVLTSSAYVWAFPYKMALMIILGIITLVLLIVVTVRLLTGKQKKLEKKLEEQINELEQLKNKLKDNFPQGK